MREPPVKKLLEHDARLRVLARRLIANANDADDLVQDVYVSALERAPIPTGLSTRWWRELLRLRARTMRRQADQRRRREFVVAIPEGASIEASTDEERAALLRALDRALKELDEPYRATMQMRFIEQLAPIEIAERLDVPVRTVHTRVTRGLTQLRGRMEREYKNGSWAAVILAFRGSDSGEPLSVAPRRLALRTLVLGAAALLAVSVPWYMLHASTQPSTPPMTVEVARSPQRERTVVSAARPERRVAEGRRSGSNPPAPDPEPATTAATPRPSMTKLAGQVVDVGGTGQAGVPVRWEPGASEGQGSAFGSWAFAAADGTIVETTSSPDGSFELSVPADSDGRVLADGGGYRPVLAESLLFSGRSRSLQLIVARERSIVGRVLDIDGEPLPRASLSMRASPAFAASQRRPERSWMLVRAIAWSDAQGHFELAGAFAMEGALIEVEKDGYVPQRITLDADGALDIDIRLEPALQPHTPVRGFVVDELGAPIAGAVIAAAKNTAVAREDGSFELASEGMQAKETLWVIAAERLPVQVEVFRRDDGGFHLPDPFIVEVVHPSLAIEGRVVDAAGLPVAGALVWCDDMTMAGSGREAFSVEDTVNPDYTLGPYRMVSDEHGAFRIPYLLDRTYRIGAVLRATMHETVSAPAPAGTRGLVLTLPTDQIQTAIDGRVVTKDGEPVVGATIGFGHHTAVILGQGMRYATAMYHVTVETDEEGRFEFPEYAAGNYFLDVLGDDTVQTIRPVPDPVEGQRRNLAIVVGRRARFRLLSHASCPTATHAALLNAEGERLMLYVAAEEVGLVFDRMPYIWLTEGRYRPLILISPDTATTIVFYENERELRREPIELSAEKLNKLTF